MIEYTVRVRVLTGIKFREVETLTVCNFEEAFDFAEEYDKLFRLCQKFGHVVAEHDIGSENRRVRFFKLFTDVKGFLFDEHDCQWGVIETTWRFV